MTVRSITSSLCFIAAAVAFGGAPTAWAQISPPANPAVPSTETPPGGVPRGVVAPPAVDPGMVTPPPQAAVPTMPVITPPAVAK